MKASTAKESLSQHGFFSLLATKFFRNFSLGFLSVYAFIQAHAKSALTVKCCVKKRTSTKKNERQESANTYVVVSRVFHA